MTETTTSTEIYCGYAVGSRPPADRCLAASVNVSVDVNVHIDLKCRRLPPAACSCCCCFLIFVLIGFGFGIATRIRIRLPVAVAVAGSKDQAHLHCVLRALSLDLEGGKWSRSKGAGGGCCGREKAGVEMSALPPLRRWPPSAAICFV